MLQMPMSVSHSVDRYLRNVTARDMQAGTALLGQRGVDARAHAQVHRKDMQRLKPASSSVGDNGITLKRGAPW